MAAMAHASGMGVGWPAPIGSMRVGLAGGRASHGVQGGVREVWFGNGRVKTRGMHAWACKAEEDAELPKEVVNPLDLGKEFQKALESEESKVSGANPSW